MKLNINEIFLSFQGEGKYIGYLQLFIRFQGCNLYCDYCDTLEALSNNINFFKLYDINSNLLAEEASQINVDDLYLLIEKYYSNYLKEIHSIVFTGGEPLLQCDGLLELCKKFNKEYKIFLETNGILYENLLKIVDFIDIISMDIKLPSQTGKDSYWYEHEKFIEILKMSKNVDYYFKIVSDKNIKDDELIFIKKLIGDEIIFFQPKFSYEISNKELIFIYELFRRHNIRIRIIPQMHKYFKIK